VAVIGFVIDIVVLAIVLQAVLSWFPSYPGSALYPIKSYLNRLVDPIYAPIRKIIPPIRTGSGMAIDIAPMILILFLLVILKPLFP
jgi:YggT family protein